MVTALYRRYRPENFSELIGQTQVTDPLMTALRTNRVNHAYLFSGPRGCGKTTSARILARCLNCVEGPTDTPCGACPSCVELSRDGGGSLDVVEIDAASHNGVDDARDLRERAVFAPARDRYKIFILDEAHMVTPQGFNALLKIVEEPPEHIKFIFATTEPEKVIGTIRSRTHHYPFRLVPPAQMLEYVTQLSESEKVEVEAGVLPLVVRAGGGSVRDTLSLLDQLIAGSDGAKVLYERAVALLGYTHGALLSEVIDAIAARDAAAAFSSVDRVIQTGQDPRRFVEDLLERLRDLVIVAAFPQGSSSQAASVLRGVQQEELDQMAQQAARFGSAELSRAADVVGAALTDMTGATSPRLHLELMIARILVPASDNTERGTLARVERLERRVGVESPGQTESTPAAVASPPRAPIVDVPAAEAPAPALPEPKAASPEAPRPAVAAEAPVVETAEPVPAPAGPEPVVPVTLQQVKDSWPQILETLEKLKRSAWMVLATAQVRDLRDGNILVLTLPSQRDVDDLKDRSNPGKGTADFLKKAVAEILGFTPLLLASVDAGATTPAAPARVATMPASTPTPATDAGGWATVSIPGAEPRDEDAPPPDEPPAEEPPAARSSVPAAAPAGPSARASSQASSRPGKAPSGGGASRARYGEAVVREILGANFIEEQPHSPRVTPGAS
ncbi:MAG TPA: DNA polymerase III subunit gamma and tau [Homoserinimonas sp.]|nr:DNA polymerase III subunit gamma and tau [Homoserinimonas sp.]